MSKVGGDPSASGGDLEPRRLHPLPRGLVELYGLLAVLVVLVPGARVALAMPSAEIQTLLGLQQAPV